jgi:trimethylamine--corrinoid protein Co-methyltransferase
MGRVRFGISGGLSAEQLQALHQRALEVLDTVGMDVNSPRTLEYLDGRPGFRVQGARVRIDPSLVEECVGLCRARGAGILPTGHADEDPILEILSGYPTHFVPWRGGGMRPINEADLVGLSRLVDALHPRGVRGGAPGVPQDVPPAIRGIRAYRIGAEYCRCGGSAPATNDEDIEWLYRMDEVMGQPFGLGVFVVNPLRVEGATFDQLLKLKGKTFPVMVGCMPQMGTSTPVKILGAFVVGIAATWGSFAMVREITGHDDIQVECRVWPTSMKSLEIVYGSPEMVLGDLVLNQLRTFYGWRGPDADAFHSSALFPDQQAAAQRASFATAMALAGNRSFRFGGLLGVDLVFSPEQLLCDVETLGYAKHVARGFEFSEEAFCMDAIRRVGPSGSFLMDDSTLDHVRDEMWQPDLWTFDSLGSWLAGRTRLAGEKAVDRIDALIAGQSWRLDPAKARALDEITSAAERALLA